jgi:hypothetical protein
VRAAAGFDAFWLFYLREHRRPGTRALHIFGTTIVLFLLAAAVATHDWRLLAAAPFVGYGFAWLGHFAVERNRPATFTHPLWSLRADLRMWRLWVTGRLGGALTAAGIEERENER